MLRPSRRVPRDRLLATSSATDGLERHDEELQRWYYDPLAQTTARVAMHSFMSRVHGITSSEIHDMVRDQLRAIDPQLSQTIVCTGAVACDVGDRDQEPDESFRPRGAASRTLTIVTGVMYKHKSRNMLVNKLHR